MKQDAMVRNDNKKEADDINYKIEMIETKETDHSKNNEYRARDELNNAKKVSSNMLPQMLPSVWRIFNKYTSGGCIKRFRLAQILAFKLTVTEFANIQNF